MWQRGVLGRIRVAGGARLDMAICTLLVTMASPACLRAVSSDKAAKNTAIAGHGKKACLLDVGGSTRIALAAMLSQGGFGWANLEPPFIIAVLRYPSYPWLGD